MIENWVIANPSKDGISNLYEFWTPNRNNLFLVALFFFFFSPFFGPPDIMSIFVNFFRIYHVFFEIFYFFFLYSIVLSFIRSFYKISLFDVSFDFFFFVTCKLHQICFSLFCALHQIWFSLSYFVSLFNSILITFDIIIMFPHIDNNLGSVH